MIRDGVGLLVIGLILLALSPFASRDIPALEGLNAVVRRISLVSIGISLAIVLIGVLQTAARLVL